MSKSFYLLVIFLLLETTFPLVTLGRTIMISVGLENYDPGLGAGVLDGTAQRASDIADAMTAFASEWPEREVIVDGLATKTALRAKIQTYAATLGSGDVFFYFHSGHGYQVIGTDEIGLLAYDGTYSEDELALDLAGFIDDVKVVVVIEACLSGGLFKSPGAASANWKLGTRVLDRVAEYRGRTKATMESNIGFITSSQEGQDSYGAPGYSGFFSYYYLDAITKADGDGDGQISFYETYEYTAPLTTALANDYAVVQVPAYANPTVLQNTFIHEIYVPPHVYTEAELNKTLSSGCMVNNEYVGSHGWFLYFPVMVIGCLALLRKKKLRQRVQYFGR